MEINGKDIKNPAEILWFCSAGVFALLVSLVFDSDMTSIEKVIGFVHVIFGITMFTIAIIVLKKRNTQ